MYVNLYLFSLYKPPNTDDITPDRADIGRDLLEIGKIERDIAEKETFDKDKDDDSDDEEEAALKKKERRMLDDYDDDFVKPVVCVKDGCDLTGAFS